MIRSYLKIPEKLLLLLLLFIRVFHSPQPTGQYLLSENFRIFFSEFLGLHWFTLVSFRLFNDTLNLVGLCNAEVSVF